MSEQPIESEVAAVRRLAADLPFMEIREFDLEAGRLLLFFDVRTVVAVVATPRGEWQPEFARGQTIEIQFPSDYPEQPPALRWQSPIFHPNLSPTGDVSLVDIGLTWESRMPLALICERIWDVVRWAYVETQDAANSSAGRWFGSRIKIPVPVDDRLLIEANRDPLANVFSYRRKAEGGSGRSDFEAGSGDRGSRGEGSDEDGEGDGSVYYIE